MAILDFNNKEEVRRYNEFVEKSDYGRFQQNVEWIDVKKNWGHEAVYVEENGEIVAAMLILIKKVLGQSIFYAQAAPVCDVYNIDLVEKLMDEVDKLAKKHKAFVFQMDPDVEATKELRDKYVEKGFKVTELGDNFDQSNLIQPIYTFEKKLNFKNEEELMKTFNSKTRYEIRYSLKKGVKFEHGNTEDLVKRFFKVHKETCIRKKIAYREYEYYKNLMDAMGDKARIYVASHEGDDIATGLAINIGYEVFYVYAGTSNIKRNLNASKQIIYQMMVWGVETGAKKFNMGGFMHLDKKSGLYIYKSSFAGEEGLKRKIGQIDKVYNPFMNFMYHKVLPIRNNVRNFLSGSGLE